MYAVVSAWKCAPSSVSLHDLECSTYIVSNNTQWGHNMLQVRCRQYCNSCPNVVVSKPAYNMLQWMIEGKYRPYYAPPTLSRKQQVCSSFIVSKSCHFQKKPVAACNMFQLRCPRRSISIKKRCEKSLLPQYAPPTLSRISVQWQWQHKAAVSWSQGTLWARFAVSQWRYDAKARKKDRK